MEVRRLGSSDIEPSVLGLGCNTFSFTLDQAQATGVVRACLDEGVTFFDTADYYGDSEILLGRALRGHRDTAVIATKWGNDLRGRLPAGAAPRGSARYVRLAVEASLARLGTDVIDLYQQHVPDPATPVEDTMAALSDLRREGKIRAFGCSNLPAPQLEASIERAGAMGLGCWASTQNRYNLLERGIEADIVPVCLTHAIGLIGYFPLANGLLTGKYARGVRPPPGARLTEQAVPWRTRAPAGLDLLSEETFARLDPLVAFAESRGVSLLHVALGALAARPVITCLIAGATSPEQVRANAAAVRWRPEPGDWEELDRATVPAGGTS